MIVVFVMFKSSSKFRIMRHTFSLHWLALRRVSVNANYLRLELIIPYLLYV